MSKRDILYLSHCCPSLPDKGERIRAFHEVKYLAQRYRLHVVCLTRDDRALALVPEMRNECASFSIHKYSPKLQIMHAALRYMAGSSLTVGFYENKGVNDAVRFLREEVRLAATVAFSSSMAHYAPSDVPLLLDMVDVDSEKWLQYSQSRHPKQFYRAEGLRIREVERIYTSRAKCVILTTEQERNILRACVPESYIRAIQNGVDSHFFDSSKVPQDPQLASRRYLVMVGAMDYYPNSEGAAWFARYVFPRLRARCPDLEFFIVGHEPHGFLQRLAASIPGVTVTGYVPDVRPYVAHSLAAVAPLRIARGIQNKVLEALAMGKRVMGSVELGMTFGADKPKGLVVCDTVEDYIGTLMRFLSSNNRECDSEIRQGAIDHYSWDQKMACLDCELQAVIDNN